jgi:MFS family permease
VRTPGRVNWLAALLMIGGLSAVLIAVSETTSWGWGSPRTLGLIAVGIAILAAWVLVELRSREPLVDMAMMRLRAVWTTNLAAFLLGAGMYTAFILIPQFVETPARAGFGFGASITGGGLFLLPCTLMLLAVGLFAGRIAARFGSKAALVAGSVFATLSFVLLLAAHAQRWTVFLASGLLGVGIGLAFAALGALIVGAVPAHQTGVASGMNTVLRTVGGALGAQIGATFIAGNQSGGLPTAHGFDLAFVTALLALLLGVAASLAVPGRRGGGGVREPAPERHARLAAQEA